jgi:PKD repeat protein
MDYFFKTFSDKFGFHNNNINKKLLPGAKLVSQNRGWVFNEKRPILIPLNKLSMLRNLPFPTKKRPWPVLVNVLWINLFIAIFCIKPARAQLSGSYTVCASGCNYSSISAAITDLKSKGISTAVTFNVAYGTYSENPSINGNITGASATNTITFKGVGRGKSVITYAGNTLALSYTSYITFTGFSITSNASLSSTYTIYSYYTKNCTISNCDISITNAPCCSPCIYDYYTNYWTVQNCRISGGYFSIFAYGSSDSSTYYTNNRYINNRIVNFDSYAFVSWNLYQPQYKNNIIDSTSGSYGCGFFSFYENGATYEGNKVIASLSQPFYIYEANYNYNTDRLTVVNNMCANYNGYAYFYLNGSSNALIAHNTFYGGSTTDAAIIDGQNGSGISLISNIYYTNRSGSAATIWATFGQPLTSVFKEIDGNTYLNTSGIFVYYNGTGFSSIDAMRSMFSNYTYTSAYNGQKGYFEQFASTIAPVFLNPPKDLHISQSKPAPFGVYAGIDYDIDGNARCRLFPTSGADESNYGKGKPTVKFFLPARIYPGSPTYIYQTAKAGEPKIHSWYLNGAKVSDSVVLKTSSFVTGSNTLKLVTRTCGGNDSFSQTFTVSAPTAVPGTDFIADRNTIKAGEKVKFQDLSTNGPTKWQWSISPDSMIVNGTKVSTIAYSFGSEGYQNPIVQFIYGGKYKICMTASNGLGKGPSLCKTNYINVIPTVNLGIVSVVKDPEGYLYDNGGPDANYNYVYQNNNIQSLLIDPCADSVYMTFSLFDLYCGYDFLRLYEGTDNSGRPLWNSKCSSLGYNSEGPGYTGGTVYSCTMACMPNVARPDTFKAKKSMYIEMVCNQAYNSQGFAAYWWSKPKTSTKPKASFVSSNAGDSVCVNGNLEFTNTTKIDPNDVPTFLWDLDGDITTFECVGSCTSATYPYFLNGPLTLSLIATNCGGSDTATRQITVFDPATPKAAFKADNLSPTTNDIVFFSTDVVQCVDDYRWTITPSAGTSGSVVYMNGTTELSANPQVNFTGTGYYDVKLYVDNLSGSQKDSILKTKYINVRNAYCVPSVATINSGIGISEVVFNTISNKMTQASTDYSNFAITPGLSTSVAIGASYNLTVSRDPAKIFESINRTAYIDWNGNGNFTDAGEIYALDSNSYSTDITKKITIPKTATVGATVLRIAVNRGSYSNKPCGQNEFGEYQDYRVYITPYNILPVIKLSGHHGLNDTIFVEQGNVFTEPGYTATSFLYGNITKNIVRTSRKLYSTNSSDSFNNIVPATYIFSYNVTDSAGNKAITQYRVVVVTRDKTSPALVVDKPDTTIIEVTKTPVHPVPIPKVISAMDLVDGNLAGSVRIDSGKVQTNIVGTYIVAYSVSDLSGNTAVIYRVVQVVDTIAPVIKLLGNNPDSMEVFTRYIEPGVNVSDNYYTSGLLIPKIVISKNVDTSHLGTYIVTYYLKDPSGNIAVSVSRTVVVVDTVKPVISLIGAQTDSVAVFTVYNDPGVDVSDNYNGKSDLVVTKTGTFYSSFPSGTKAGIIGSYTIIYTVSDKSGNKVSVARNVLVKDWIAPVIKLKGITGVSVCRWSSYKDEGYSISDNYDKVSDIKVDTTGSFITDGGTTVEGLYTLQYVATDKSGNTSSSEVRYIQVKSVHDWPCISGIAPGLSLDKYINIYPNPSSGIFTIRVSLPMRQKVRISLMNLLGQEIDVIQNGVLDNNIIQVDMSSQPAGVYMLNFVTGSQTLTRRIEITK